MTSFLVTDGKSIFKQSFAEVGCVTLSARGKSHRRFICMQDFVLELDSLKIFQIYLVRGKVMFYQNKDHNKDCSSVDVMNCFVEKLSLVIKLIVYLIETSLLLSTFRRF